MSNFEDIVKNITDNDNQVRIAIAVLQSYVNGSLLTDLCDELDEAIDKAAQELYNRVDDDDPYEYEQEVPYHPDDPAGW